MIAMIDDVRLYCGDMRDVLPIEVANKSVAVVVTDPPYAMFRYLREMAESRRLDAGLDVQWQGEIFIWACQWMFPVADALRDDGVIWLFCNINYAGAFMRLATLIGYPMQQMTMLSERELLLYCSKAKPSNDVVYHMLNHEVLNVHGTCKHPQWLKALIEVSPVGPVLDPFCGQGSTLVAARAAGRQTIGIEINADIAARAREALAS